VGFRHSKGKRTTSALARFGTYEDSKWLKGSASPGGPDKAYESKVQVRVAPDGQPEFDSQIRVWGGDVQRIQSGRQTYVLYDPEDPEHCDIDRERLTKEFGPAPNGKHRVDIPLKGTEEEAEYRRGARLARRDKLVAKRAELGLDPVPVHGKTARGPEITLGATSLEDMMARVAQAGRNAPTPDPEERLGKLADLHDRGVLTDEEFAAQKAKILGEA
jgi:Short C-terminal domain